MQIWVIGRGFPNTKNQMLGSFELDQAKMLLKHGNIVSYFSVDLRSIRRWRPWGTQRFKDDGIDVWTINIPVGRQIYAILGKALLGLMKKAEKAKGLPDVIYVHYPTNFPYSQFEYFQKRNVKIVCLEHWTHVQKKTLKKNEIEHLSAFVQKADTIMAVGDRLKTAIIDLTHTTRNIVLLPNIVMSSFEYSAIKKEKGDSFVFIAVGRLVKVKRFDLLIRSFAATFANNDKVSLNIIGDGDQKNALHSLIDELELHNVFLKGAMNRDGVASQMKAADALIMSSELETFGVPVIEAMACGLPVVTTDAIGFRDWFTEKCGIIVPINDEEQLANAISLIYKNYSSYDKEAIADYASRMFGEETIYAKLEMLMSK